MNAKTDAKAIERAMDTVIADSKKVNVLMTIKEDAIGSIKDILMAVYARKFKARFWTRPFIILFHKCIKEFGNFNLIA